MPELPEVETVRRGLAPVLEGRRLKRAEARRPDLRFALPERFVERLEPGEPPDGQRYLRQGFSRYHRARFEADPGTRAQRFYERAGWVDRGLQANGEHLYERHAD